MAAAKSTRASAASAKSATGSKHQPGIQRFTRSSKPGILNEGISKQLSLQDNGPDVVNEPETSGAKAQKRVREHDADVPSTEAKRRRTQPAALTTPRKQRPNPQALPTPETTPHKPSGIRALDVSQYATPTKPKLSSLATPPASPCPLQRRQAVSRPCTTLPDRLYDLIQLNAALLQGLSLHSAHSGSVTPIDLRALRPSVTKIWGKRSISTDDIRRCLNIINTASSEGPVFNLYDYEYSRVCIERARESTLSSVISKHIDEDGLNDSFELALKHLWEDFRLETESDDADKFVDSLPLEPVVLCPSLNKIKPRLAEGQRRLEHLKGVSLHRRSADKAQASTTAQEALARRSSSSIANRSSSLLARLKAKEQLAAAQPEADAAVRLERRAALSRLHEMVPILAVPRAKTSQRAAQALPMLVQTVQDSARSSLSKAEVKDSLRVLHRELQWPGFLDMIDTGGLLAVVVDRTKLPGDWSRRIDQAMELYA